MSSSSQHFWDVWRQHSEYLFQQSVRMMRGNVADAEDAYGAAMLRAHEFFTRRGGEPDNPRAWLRKVLANICLDTWRLRQRYAEEPVESRQESSALGLAPSAEALLLGAEREHEVRRHILALPTHLREPFVLRVLQERPYPEIAGRMGLTGCNVRKRIQLANDTLRRTLAHEAPEARRRAG